MYFDLLDTVRTSQIHFDAEKCREHAVQGETMLVHLLLGGHKPILTQAQMMDSSIIHHILGDERMGDYFLSLIRDGRIGIVKNHLFENKIGSMQDYFLHTLQRGMDGDSVFFEYSSLPFLHDLEPKVRRDLHARLTDGIERHTYNFAVDGLPHEKREFLEIFAHNLYRLDWVIRGRFIKSQPFTKNLDLLFRKQYEDIALDMSSDEADLILCEEMASAAGLGSKRSNYYHFLEDRKGYYASSTIDFVREMVDHSYNEAMASSIPGAGFNLNYSRTFMDKGAGSKRRKSWTKRESVKLLPSSETDYITWERLVDIFYEVDDIQETKGMSRVDALKEYKRRTSLKPAIQLAKYATMGFLPELMGPVLPVMDVAAEAITMVSGDLIDESFKRPSIADARKAGRKWQGERSLINEVIEFESCLMEE